MCKSHLTLWGGERDEALDVGLCGNRTHARRPGGTTRHRRPAGAAPGADAQPVADAALAADPAVAGIAAGRADLRRRCATADRPAALRNARHHDLGRLPQDPGYELGRLLRT